ncbi:MAG TPA: DUF4358 domain-containing protein [Candidatus Aphodoplasma excrementigallinarum]|uniref:DUF4358 domain-containing protein n=1 Tax=Candidatus Aphodoplasma excrementigallinarum TaxID=2840673 RepID=A0A9D1NJ42_9FIRM|nr:DUF4358 domain-containing protein [Candidatus Aphodoplasma excrementigallinarum]
MWKKTTKASMTLLSTALLLICLLTGCGGNQAPLPDAETLANRLLTEQAFTDELVQLAPEVALALYQIDASDVAASAVYTGTGATAEEVAVFEAVDAEAAGRIRAAAEARVADQKQSFENYIPTEIPKLQQAVVASRDTIVVLCVPAESDETARSICDEYGLQ